MQVIDEATANCAEHAYSDPGHIGDMHVELTCTAAGAIAASITDFGRWRPVPADPGYRGRGLQLMRTIASHTEIDCTSAGTTVHLELTPPA